MTIHEILLKAKERISKPSRWCKHWSISDDGRRICAATAIGWAAGCQGPLSRYSVEALTALSALAGVSGVNSQWSDYDRVAYRNGESHKAVMAMFDRAIEQLELARLVQAPDA